MNSWPMNCLAGITPGKKTDSYAIAPYFGGDQGSDENSEILASLTVDELMPLLQSRVRSTIQQQIPVLQAVSSRNIDLITYEAGQHLVRESVFWGGDDDTTVDELMMQANRHPAMYDIYLEYLTRWETLTPGLMTLFVSVERYSRYGSWGMKEYWNQADEDSPKWRAAIDFIQGHRYELQQADEHIRAFYIGHSLTDYIPSMVSSLLGDTDSVEFEWTFQSIPGAPLRWQWGRMQEQDYTPNYPFFAGFYDSTYGLPSGDFNALVLTESVPRNMGEWSINETYEYTRNFYNYAISHNPGSQVYLYEVWHCIQSGTPTGCDFDVDSAPWRQRLDDDLPMWESVVDSLNAITSPERPVCLIPGGQGLARVYDAIIDATLPGIDTIDDLFEHLIHLNDTGRYFIALIHYAMITQRAPTGLPSALTDQWGSPFDTPDAELAVRLQEIALETVTSYANTCYTGTGTTVTQQEHPNLPLATDLGQNFPNPFNPTTTIRFQLDSDDFVNLSVFDLTGRKVMTLKNSRLAAGIHHAHFDGSTLSSGIYLYRLTTSNSTTTRKMILIK